MDLLTTDACNKLSDIWNVLTDEFYIGQMPVKKMSGIWNILTNEFYMGLVHNKCL